MNANMLNHELQLVSTQALTSVRKLVDAVYIVACKVPK